MSRIQECGHYAKRIRRTVLIPTVNHRSDVKECNVAFRCKFHCHVTTTRLFVQLKPSRVCFTCTYAILLLSSFNRFFFFCLFTGVCVNFCSFAHYSGVKLVLSSQDLFMSAKLNTFHAIMQNYVIFFTGILITSQNKTYSVRLIIKNSKFYT